MEWLPLRITSHAPTATTPATAATITIQRGDCRTEPRPRSDASISAREILPVVTTSPESTSLRNPSSSLRTSFAVWKRRSGSFSRQCETMRPSSRGFAGLSSEMDFG
jgi:hypothetical protein